MQAADQFVHSGRWSGAGALKELVKKLNLEDAVRFSSSVPIAQVRAIMRRHDVMVFASNALDGWGATVSEALEEGVPVVGTVETGAPAALLPANRLFQCGKYRQLADILIDVCQTRGRVCMPRGYTAVEAAERILDL